MSEENIGGSSDLPSIETGSSVLNKASLQPDEDVFANVDELNADQIEAEMSMLAKQEAELESQRLLQQQTNKLLAIRVCAAELKDEIANEKDRESHIKSSHNHRRVCNVVLVDIGGTSGSHLGIQLSTSTTTNNIQTITKCNLLSQLRHDSVHQSNVASTLEALGMDNDPEEEQDICTRSSGKQNMPKKIRPIYKNA